MTSTGLAPAERSSTCASDAQLVSFFVCVSIKRSVLLNAPQCTRYAPPCATTTRATNGKRHYQKKRRCGLPCRPLWPPAALAAEPVIDAVDEACADFPDRHRHGPAPGLAPVSAGRETSPLPDERSSPETEGARADEGGRSRGLSRAARPLCSAAAKAGGGIAYEHVHLPHAESGGADDGHAQSRAVAGVLRLGSHGQNEHSR
jgi:hypothetical protein